MVIRRKYFIRSLVRFKKSKNNICPFCWGTGFVVDEDGNTSICAGCFGTGHV